jgi:16S rRNA (uracil1498-N3)-methyltransferase
VTLFDGGGAEFLARIERLGRSEVELSVVERIERDCESGLELTLAVALPKGDRQRRLVEKAVELGARRLIPLETTRGVAQPVAKALARLRRTVIEASKQCGRNRLLEVTTGQPFAAYCQSDCRPEGLRLLAQPAGEATLSDILRDRPEIRGLTAAIGPEGGWTDEELGLARAHGWQSVRLGPRVLRVETAALAIAAIVAETAS